MKKIIHIGANKAASTTLQRHLFSKDRNLIYLGEDCNNYNEYKSILDSLVSDDDFHFSIRETEKLFNNYIEKSDGKTFIYSNEDILSSRVPSQCAKRLYKILPDAEILIIIRNQLTAIPSWYANHGSYLKQVPRNYWRRYVSFDDWIEYCISFIKYSPLESFLFYKHLELYNNLFGEGKINILFFEEFIQSKKTFIRKLSDLLDIDPFIANKLLDNKHERPRNTIRQHKYNQIKSNYFYNTPLSKLLPFSKSIRNNWNKYLSSGEPIKIDINEKWRKVLVDIYREDNRRLSSEYSIDLASYNYPI